MGTCFSETASSTRRAAVSAVDTSESAVMARLQRRSSSSSWGTVATQEASSTSGGVVSLVGRSDSADLEDVESKSQPVGGRSSPSWGTVDFAGCESRTSELFPIFDDVTACVFRIWSTFAEDSHCPQHDTSSNRPLLAFLSATAAHPTTNECSLRRKSTCCRSVNVGCCEAGEVPAITPRSLLTPPDRDSDPLRTSTWICG